MMFPSLSIEPRGSQKYIVTETVPDRPMELFAVNLRAFDWNGSCTCRTFTGYCEFLLGYSKERQRCDHILAAAQWAFDNEFPALAERADKNIIRLDEYANEVGGTAGY